jgi:type III pantothenate kinase
VPDGKNEAKNSTMNLTIDMGNTRVKYAVFDGGTVVSDGCSEEFDEAVIDRILAAHPGITQAIVATTRGPVDDTVALVRRRIGRCLRLSPQLPLPIRNGYTTPETLGEDRLAAAVGAASLYPGRNLLIVDFGTAITIDQVSADGVFRGGNISPGMQMRYKALHQFTGRLPLIDSNGRKLPMGRDTETAIRAGVLKGMEYEISGYIEAMKHKYPELLVFLTGGDDFSFDSSVKSIIFADRFLVLKGLNRILNYNNGRISTSGIGEISV